MSRGRDQKKNRQPERKAADWAKQQPDRAIAMAKIIYAMIGAQQVAQKNDKGKR